jgi:hypothetical protein
VRIEFLLADLVRWFFAERVVAKLAQRFAPLSRIAAKELLLARSQTNPSSFSIARL